MFTEDIFHSFLLQYTQEATKSKWVFLFVCFLQDMIIHFNSIQFNEILFICHQITKTVASLDNSQLLLPLMLP